MLINKIKNIYSALSDKEIVSKLILGLKKIKNEIYKTPLGSFLAKLINSSQARQNETYLNNQHGKIYTFFQKKLGFVKINQEKLHSNLNVSEVLLSIELAKKANRWRDFALWITLIAIVLFTWDKYPNSKRKSPDYHGLTGYIARVQISGPILIDSDIYASLKKIRDNNNIKAVILEIDSPGGMVGPSEKIYTILRQIDQKKPVVAVMENTAASGAYMIAVAARHIFAMRSTLTGSIGVYSQLFEATELIKRAGIATKNVKSSPIKGSPNPFEKLSPEVLKLQESLVIETYVLFRNIVTSRRNIPKDKIDFVTNGQVFTGTQALKYGLIDAIGDEETAQEWLYANKLVPQNTEVRKIGLKKSITHPALLQNMAILFSEVAIKIWQYFTYTTSL